MRKTLLNNKGFAHLGLALTLLVVVVVGSTGAYIYHVNRNPKPATPASSSSSTHTAAPPASTSTKTTPPPVPKPNPNPYAGWTTYTSKLGGVSIKYPSNWGGVNTPSNLTFTWGHEEIIHWQSPYEEFDGQQLSVELWLVATTAAEKCSVGHFYIFKAQNITANGHQLTLLSQRDNNGNFIDTMYLSSTTGLSSGGTTTPCSTYIKSPLPQTKTLQIWAQIVTPDPHTSGVINPLTPQQYDTYPLINQVMKSFESITFS